MKKQVLLGVALGVGSFAFAQSNVPNGVITHPKLNPSVANRAEVYLNQQAGAEADPFTSLVNSATVASRPQPRNQARAYTDTVIGNTGYQLQTNSSICNRFIKSPDGTMSATWTFSSQQSSWTDRGTGYNYFNGSAWGPAPTTRIESVRTGFTNIGVTATGAEVIVAHEASDLHISQRPVKGTGTWSNAAFLGAPDVWSRLAVGGANGMTLHVISQTTGVGGTPFMGQNGAIAYSRSLDGGVTWDKLHTVIPEIDNTSYLGFGGDSYAIDAKGDTIVIVAGGFDVDVVMIKSIDNGTTWTKTIVYPFAIPMYDKATMNTDLNGDGTGDTLTTNDASVAVLLDNQGKAHVWYGNMRVTENPGGTALSYFPGTDGIMYWNESMGSALPVMITTAKDIDGDGLLNVTAWGNYQCGFSTFPNAGIDAAGNIYLSYASIYEGIAANGAAGSGLSYRHTYVMSTPDGGTTWCTPIDVSDPEGLTHQDYIEGVYGAMAKDVDNYVHLIVQTDGSPGNGVSGTTPDPQSGSADIIYKKVPVSDVLCVATSVHENTPSLTAMDLYPNPASENATLAFSLANKGNVTIRVYNVTGQMVAEIANQDFSAGKHTMEMNFSKFNSGIYMVSMVSADGTANKKIIIK